MTMPQRVLVTGGVRSGKSTHAESLLAGYESVTYVATGPSPDPAVDSEWSERVTEHRRRRPAMWHTLETTDLADVLERSDGPMIIECLATWVTAVLDELGAWEGPGSEWEDALAARLDATVSAWAAAPGPLIAVTNEVGMGVVPAYRSGRVFRDALGTVNRRIAAVSDRVDLVVAGRVLHL